MKQLNANESARILRDTGLLFEINRLVLHPRGLALFVGESDNGTQFIGGLLDDRGDLESLFFDDESITDSAAKLAAFEATDKERILVRRKALGYVVQPLPARAATDCPAEASEATCEARGHAATSSGLCACGVVSYDA